MSDRKSRQIIRRAKEINKDALLVVVGCYAQVAREELEKIEDIDIILNNEEKDNIVEIVENHLGVAWHATRTTCHVAPATYR